MKPNILFVLLLPLLTLGGCVPNAVKYYRPSADGGTVRADNCVPIESIIDIEIGNTHKKLKITAQTTAGADTNIIFLDFWGESWNSIRFTSTVFSLVDLDKNIPIVGISAFAWTDARLMPLTRETYTAIKRPSGSSAPKFSAQIRLPDPMATKFDLSIPPIIIDKEEFEIPTIRFELNSWIGISPFNC